MERLPVGPATLNRLIRITTIEDASAAISPRPEDEYLFQPTLMTPPGDGPRSLVPERLLIGDRPAAWFAFPGPVDRVSGNAALARDPNRIPGLEGHPPTPGVLAIDIDNHFYAISFGAGWYRIRDEFRDQRFGLRVALRCLDASSLAELLCRSTGTGVIESTMTPSGAELMWVRPNNLGEIVRRITGRSLPIPLSGPALEARLYGVGGLRLRLGRSDPDLVSDLRTITAIHDRPPSTRAALIDHVAAVSDPQTRHRLDAELEALFGDLEPDGHSTRVALMVPDSAIEHRDRAVRYQVRVNSARFDAPDPPSPAPKPAVFNPNDRNPIEAVLNDLTLNDLIGPAQREPSGFRLSTLRTGYISISDRAGGHRPLHRTPAVKWIEASARLSDRRFVLLDGIWHEFDPDFADHLRQEVGEILAASAPIALPGRRPEWGRVTYLRQVQAHSPEYLFLEREFTVPAESAFLGRRQAPGDLLGPNDELIHVQEAPGSAGLARLFERGLASWQRLHSQFEARQEFGHLIQEIGNGRRLAPDFCPTRMVFAIHQSEQHLTPDDLFPFAQAALAQVAAELRDDQIDLHVVGIEQISSTAADAA